MLEFILYVMYMGFVFLKLKYKKLNNLKMEVKILKKNSTKGFSFLAGINRAINPSQVTRLADSIDKMGIIRPVVITKIKFIDSKEKEYIIDGQHLYTACLRNNLDIPYVTIEIKNVQELVETIALLNASSKAWTLQDYIQSWKIVNKDYQTLQELFQRYDIELSQLASILNKGYCLPKNSHFSTKLLKSGNFVINNITAALLMLDRVTDALKTVPRLDRMSNVSFIAAFSTYSNHSKYDHDKTMKYLLLNKNKFLLSTQDPEEFNKLFNQIK